MQTAAFGYKCQECGQGVVLRQVLPEYKTRINGYPVVIRDAVIGVCNRCGAKHFDARETARWRTSLESTEEKLFLKPQQITAFRKSMGLSMEQFAAIIGSTRQSLHHWERADRRIGQSRMADLMMRLAQESQNRGSVNVLDFLTREAERIGMNVRLRSESDNGRSLILCSSEKTSLLALKKQFPSVSRLALAAATEGEEPIVALIRDNHEPIGRIFYDFSSASLNIAFVDADFDGFDAEIEFSDGTVEKMTGAVVSNQIARLPGKTYHNEEEVRLVKIFPRKQK